MGGRGWEGWGWGPAQATMTWGLGGEGGQEPFQQLCGDQGRFSSTSLNQWDADSVDEIWKKLIGKNESHQALSSCMLATRLNVAQASNKYELIIKFKSEEIIVLPAWPPAQLPLGGRWAALYLRVDLPFARRNCSEPSPAGRLFSEVFAWTMAFFFPAQPHTTPQGTSPLAFFFFFFNKQLDLFQFP